MSSDFRILPGSPFHIISRAGKVGSGEYERASRGNYVDLVKRASKQGLSTSMSF